jgi:hypothetical protein
MITDPHYLLQAPDPKNYVKFDEFFGTKQKTYPINGRMLPITPQKEMVELMTLTVVDSFTGISKDLRILLERQAVIDLIEGRVGLEVLDIFDFGDPQALLFIKRVVATHIQRIKNLQNGK